MTAKPAFSILRADRASCFPLRQLITKSTSQPASGATWIGDGASGTLDLLEQSLKPGLLASLSERDFDVVEMITASQESWDRYITPQS